MLILEVLLASAVVTFSIYLVEEFAVVKIEFVKIVVLISFLLLVELAAVVVLLIVLLVSCLLAGLVLRSVMFIVSSSIPIELTAALLLVVPFKAELATSVLSIAESVIVTFI